MKIKYLPFLVGAIIGGFILGNHEFAIMWAVMGLVLVLTKQIELY